MAEEETKQDAQETAQEEAATEEQEQATEEETTESAEESEASADTSSAQEESTDASGAGEDVEVPEQFKDIVERVENMSVLELNELVKTLEKKFGVTAAAAAAPAGGGESGGGEEEQTAFTVELTAAGDQKVGVIKAVKDMLGLGLKEAKELVEGAPATLKENAAKEEAEEMKSKIEEAGGSAELK